MVIIDGRNTNVNLVNLKQTGRTVACWYPGGLIRNYQKVALLRLVWKLCNTNKLCNVEMV